MSPAQDVARILAAAGHGTVGTTIFVGNEPDTPVNTITVYDTGGTEVDTDEMDVFNPTFQVRVRNKAYATGYDLCAAIRDTLLAATQNVQNARTYYAFQVTVDVASLMKDEKDRHVFVASYRATYQE